MKNGAIVMFAGLLCAFLAPLAAQNQAPPTVTLGPGLRPVPNYVGMSVDPPPVHVPDGFTAIFNGKDLTGWHISKTARHGVTPDFHVVHGMINDRQVSEFTDTENHALNGMTSSPIAIQIHGGPVRWIPGGLWRWRNIGITELP